MQHPHALRVWSAAGRVYVVTAIAAGLLALTQCSSSNGPSSDDKPDQCVPGESRSCASDDASSQNDSTLDTGGPVDSSIAAPDGTPEGAMSFDAPAEIATLDAPNDASGDAPGRPDGSVDSAVDAATDAAPPTLYTTGFEGTCPDGWTLTGDWQCGVPTNPAGPATPFQGAQCIATGLAQDYSNDDTWGGTTATSPAIDLAAAVSPTLTFRMWIDTEGGADDGANLQISTDGGTTFAVLSAVPAYTLTVAGEPAWGGHMAALGWQPVQVDLSAYAGQTILLRFAFQSNASNNYAGVFVDAIVVQG